MKASGIFRNVTPSAKLALVNNQLGNPALKLNQGSSSEIWDYVKIATPGANQVLQFFANVNTKNKPFANIPQNQLSVGEALSVSYIAWTKITVKAGEITSFTPLCSIAGLQLATFNLLLDNSRIIKNNSLVRSNTNFSTVGSTGTNYLWYPDTNLVVPPQIPFVAELDVPANSDTATADEDTYYGCHIFGTGAILNLKSNV
jgi:hypothetical protein